jgi:hypothetical protein
MGTAMKNIFSQEIEKTMGPRGYRAKKRESLDAEAINAEGARDEEKGAKERGMGRQTENGAGKISLGREAQRGP